MTPEAARGLAEQVLARYAHVATLAMREDIARFGMAMYEHGLKNGRAEKDGEPSRATVPLAAVPKEG
jgi:hypothetical protein